MSVGWRRPWIPLVGLLCLACDRSAPARSNDTAQVEVPPPPANDTTTSEIEPAWGAELGPAFLAVGSTPDDAMVVLAAFDETHPLDSATFDIGALRNRPFALFGNGQALGTARFGADINPDLPDECTSWPLVRLNQFSDSGGRAWAVGFRPGTVEVFAVDSLAGMASADSARLTRDIARMASVAPGDTVSALRGLPFQVRRAYRFTPRGATTTILAEVVRVLNQEASPVHEHLLILATRDSLSGKLSLAYSERDAGTEEAMESSDLLFAGRLTRRDIDVMVIIRYVADGAIFSLLESRPDGTWQLRWTSSYSGC